MSETLENNYPVQYIMPLTLEDGTLVQLRPIHKDDGAKYEDIVKYISEKSMYNRFLGAVKISDKLIEKFTQLDYAKEMAIIAELIEGKEKRIIGVARFAAYQQQSAEIAITIIDQWQGNGLGKLMTNYILKIAKEMGYRTITARLFETNKAMIKILNQNDFTLRKEDSHVLVGRLDYDDEFHCLSLNW